MKKGTFLCGLFLKKIGFFKKQVFLIQIFVFLQMAGGYDSDAEGGANGAGLGGSFGEKAVSEFFPPRF